jgi:hypothetical protein
MRSFGNAVIVWITIGMITCAATALIVLSAVPTRSQTAESPEAWCRANNSDPIAVKRCIDSERQITAQERAQSPQWWCEASRAYYPAVKTCSTPWRSVTPSSSNAPQLGPSSIRSAPLPPIVSPEPTAPAMRRNQASPLGAPQATPPFIQGAQLVASPAGRPDQTGATGSPTQRSESANVGNTAVVILFVAVGILGIIVVANLRARRILLRKATSTITATIKQHLPSLVRRRAQLVRLDAYGKPQFEKWIKEVDYFVNEHIIPRLTPQEFSSFRIALLREKNIDIATLIFMLIESEILKNPAFQSFSDDMTPSEFETFCAVAPVGMLV